MVFEIQDAQRIPEILSRAFHTSLSGRPGPVIITLPEDMLRDEVDEKPIDFVIVSKSGPTNEDLATYIEELKSSKNPIIIVGGSVWSKEAALNLEKVSELTNIPIYTSHRRQSFFNNLHKNYAGDLGLGVNPQVIKNINLEIKNGEFVVLVGPSGCGKSTLLRIISGLEDLDVGEILINSEDVTSKIPSERKLSMVFQSYALFPHLTVKENVIFGLKVRKTPIKERQEKTSARARNHGGLLVLKNRKTGRTIWRSKTAGCFRTGNGKKPSGFSYG